VKCCVSLMLHASNIQQYHSTDTAPVMQLTLVKTDMMLCADKSRSIISNMCILKKLRMKSCKNGLHEDNRGTVQAHGADRVHVVFLPVLRCQFGKKTFSDIHASCKEA
jgi:hypothetical protein